MATAPNIDSPTTVADNGVNFIAVPRWSGFDWLWHGFSTRRGGVSSAYLAEEDGDCPGELNLGFTAADSAENVRENRLRFAEAVTGSRDTPLRTVRQVHSNRSVAAAEVAVDADGLMTRQPGILIGIQTADCIPVLVADPVTRAVAAFHAGWRGTVARIVELGIARMQAEFGSDPADLFAAIGPGIGPCCYTIGGEVLERFTEEFSYAAELFSQEVTNPQSLPDVSIVHLDLRVNLKEANRRQLMAAGLRPDAIATVGGCTACQPRLFYSHRASGGHAGRMMAVIGIR